MKKSVLALVATLVTAAVFLLVLSFSGSAIGYLESLHGSTVVLIAVILISLAAVLLYVGTRRRHPRS